MCGAWFTFNREGAGRKNFDESRGIGCTRMERRENVRMSVKTRDGGGYGFDEGSWRSG